MKGIAFDQTIQFGTGVCGTLSNLFILARLRGQKVHEILATFRLPSMRDGIKACHHLAMTAANEETNPDEIRNVALASSMQSAPFAKFREFPLPQYRLLGSCSFPEEVRVTTVMVNGESERESTFYSVTPAIMVDKLFAAHEARMAKDGLKQAGAKLIYLQMIAQKENHATVIDLSDPDPGFFDPNFGWIPFKSGFNKMTLSRLLTSITLEYGEQIFAYQTFGLAFAEAASDAKMQIS